MNNANSNTTGSGAIPIQDAIARRAYQIWQDAGAPAGAHEDHWRQAERELAQGERGVPREAPPATGGRSRPATGAPAARSAPAPAPASTTPHSASGSSSMSGQAAGAGGGSGRK